MSLYRQSFVLLFFALPLIAAPSPAAKKRIAENLTIVNENLDRLHKNYEATGANITTMETELKELGDLEAQHVSLQKKYQAYLVRSETELREASPSQAQDLQNKRTRATEFLSFAQRSLDDVRSRREPLKTQIATLKIRLGEYGKSIHAMELRKQELERLARSEKP